MGFPFPPLCAILDVWTDLLRLSKFCTKKGIVSLHEEGSYTVLVKVNGTTLKFPTQHIWRLKCYADPKIYGGVKA
jgi:hypothetical protein